MLLIYIYDITYMEFLDLTNAAERMKKNSHHKMVCQSMRFLSN